MPNWTDNVVEISGNVDDVKVFMDTITDNVTVDSEPETIYNLTNCFPVPKEIANVSQGSREIEGVRYDCWYDDEDGVRPMLDITKNELISKYGTYLPIDWQYRFWGTKWGDCNTTLLSDTTNGDTREVVLTFDSAWGEPFMLLNDIATKYNLYIVNTIVHEFEEDEFKSEYPWTPEDTINEYNNHRFGLDKSRQTVKEMFNNAD